jgi:hypothetical protein
VLAKSTWLAGEKTAIVSLPNYVPIAIMAIGFLALCLVLLGSLTSSIRKVLKTRE